MADVKIAYAASSALTQTNLDGISSSSTWVAGWTSAYIDNSSNLYLDYLLSVQIQVESTGLSAGEIRVYLYTEQDDTTALDIFSAGTEGTEGTATLHDTEIRDSLVHVWTQVTDTTASRIYSMPQRGVAQYFGGSLPRKFAVFITQSSGNTLETTGDPNKVIIKGVYNTVA